ncbi:MAG: acetate uptake transporter [Gemmatimonadota bacterium]
MAQLAEVKRDVPGGEPGPAVVPGMQREWWANPAVVGLMGFATTTMATGLHNVGYWGAGPVLALAIAFGGTAQFIAGVVDLRKGSIFGGSAFMAYGAFWVSLFVLDYVLPKTGITATPKDLFGYFLMWTLFTLSFFVASIKVGNHLAVLFGILLLAFLMLDGVTLGMIPAVITGWEIFITGLVAWYIASAILINSVYGRKVLPHS